MAKQQTGGVAPLDLWLRDAQSTLREAFPPTPEGKGQPKAQKPVPSDPQQRQSRREFLARQLTELARQGDPDHRPITADLLPADWDCFADFEFALRMWDSRCKP